MNIHEAASFCPLIRAPPLEPCSTSMWLSMSDYPLLMMSQTLRDSRRTYVRHSSSVYILYICQYMYIKIFAVCRCGHNEFAGRVQIITCLRAFTEMAMINVSDIMVQLLHVGPQRVSRYEKYAISISLGSFTVAGTSCSSSFVSKALGANYL